MVILPNGKTKIAPIKPVSLGFGSRIFDRYGWGGYYSWGAMFMLFRNMNLVTANGNNTYPISLFLKYINRPGNPFVLQQTGAVMSTRPGLPRIDTGQQIHIANHQPGGPVVSPGLAPLEASEPEQQPVLIQAVKEQEDSLPGDFRPGRNLYRNIKGAGNPTFFTLADVTRLLFQWSFQNNSNYQPKTNYRGVGRELIYQLFGAGQVKYDRIRRVNLATSEAAVNVDRSYGPNVPLNQPLPVVSINPSYIDQTDYYNELLTRGPSLTATHIRPMIYQWRSESPFYQPYLDRFGLPEGSRELKIIERVYPQIAGIPAGPAGVVSVQSITGIRKASPSPGKIGGGYSSKIVLNYLLRHDQARFYYDRVTLPGLRGHISVFPRVLTDPWHESGSPAQFLGNTRQQGTDNATSQWSKWMEILPGEKVETREYRSRNLSKTIETAVILAAIRGAGANHGISVPLLLPDGTKMIPNVTAADRGADRVPYRESAKVGLPLIFLQQESLAGLGKILFQAGLAALTNETRIASGVAGPISQPAFIYGQQPLSAASDIPRMAGFSKPALLAGEIMAASTINKEPRVSHWQRRLNQSLFMERSSARAAAKRSLEYKVINRQLPLIFLVQHLARLSSDLQSLNRLSGSPGTALVAPGAAARGYNSKEYAQNSRFLKNADSYGEKSRISSASSQEDGRLMTTDVMHLADRYKGDVLQRSTAGYSVLIDHHPVQYWSAYNPVFQSAVLNSIKKVIPGPKLAEEAPFWMTPDQGSPHSAKVPGRVPVIDLHSEIKPASIMQYRLPAQQGLSAANSMVEWIVRKVAGDTRQTEANNSSISRQAVADQLKKQSPGTVSPGRYPNTVLNIREHNLNTIQSYQPTESRETIRYRSLIHQDQYRSRGDHSERLNQLAADRQEVSRPTQYTSQVFRQETGADTASRSYRSTEPGGVGTAIKPNPLEKTAVVHGVSDISPAAVSLPNPPVRITERAMQRIVGIRPLVFYRNRRLSLTSTNEAKRQAESSRGFRSEQIHYTGNAAWRIARQEATTGSNIDQMNLSGSEGERGERVYRSDAAPIQLNTGSIARRITRLAASLPGGPDIRAAILASSRGESRNILAIRAPQQLKRTSTSTPPSGALTRLAYADITQTASDAVVIDRSHGAASRIGGRERWGLNNEVALAGVPSRGNRREPETMILYQDHWHNRGNGITDSLITALAPGVELNHRREALSTDKGNESAMPALTPEAVQAQIEASKAEVPHRMSNAEIRSIADRVYSEIQRKMKIDRQCRGI